MQKLELSQKVKESLGYYVYLLRYPDTKEIFYVGKGCGNRIMSHVNKTFEKEGLDVKIKKDEIIKGIHDKGQVVDLVILRHGLSESDAFEIECAVIDLLGKDELSNIVNGHHSDARGMMSITEIKIKYEAVDAVFDRNVILINVNRMFRYDMASDEIYGITRGDWKLNKRRIAKFDTVCSVYRGIIREVFMVKRWKDSEGEGNRSCFDGVVAPAEIRDRYLHKSVANYWQQGSQNPIKYAGPNQK